MSSYFKDNSLFRADLRRLNQICSSSIGPFSYLKLIDHDDELELTTSSLKILNEFQTNDPLLQLVLNTALNCIKCNGDGGLKLILYITNWLEMSHYEESKDSLLHNPQIFSSVFDWVAIYTQKLLHSDDSVFKFKFTAENIDMLIYFAKNVIRSKPASFLDSPSLDKLSVLAVKAVLNSVPNEVENNTSSFGIVKILAIPGASPIDSSYINGAVVPFNESFINESYVCKFLKLERRNFKVALSNDSLDESLIEKFEALFEKSFSDDLDSVLINKLGNDMLKNNVDIVFCQKGIQPNLRLFLERNNILVIERLGTELTETIINISCCKLENPASPINLPLYLGLLESIDILEYHKKLYFSMKGNNNKSVNTIILRNLTEEMTKETKIAVQKSVDILKSLLLQHNDIVPGAGCAESVLINCLLYKVKNDIKSIVNSLDCSEYQLINGIGVFCKGLLAPVTPLTMKESDLFIDRDYGHLFCRYSEKCQCGMIVRRDNIISPLTTSVLYCNLNNSPKQPTLDSNSLKTVIFDSFKPFNSVLNISLETSSLVLRTGICIHQKE